MSKYIIHSQYGEILDVAMQLKDEGHEVLMCVPDPTSSKIGEGIIEKIENWYRYLGHGYIWVIDGCSHGDFQDYLREKGEFVFGGSKMGDRLENERQLNQKWFKAAGFQQPLSKNFKNIDEAMKFVSENKDKKWILKQNGDAPKNLNHLGKFDGNEDMLFHLKELKKGWNEYQFGKFDCDLMEVVEGLEVAASVFFNGKEYMKNKDNKVVGFLNFEEKKEMNDGLGEVTGEMGTTFIGVTEDNKLFKEIVMRPKILEVLRLSKFRGVFDINCIKTDKGIVGLEPTMRPGVPSTSYEFIEGVKNTGKLIESVARGLNTPLELNLGVGMVMCVVSKPFPCEADMEDDATSIGEKLWILKNSKPVKDFDKEQKKHIHLQNFERKEDQETKEICYKVATKNGYLLTVTGRGKTIKDTRENLIKYIKENIYVAGQKYRTDIGARIEKYKQ